MVHACVITLILLALFSGVAASRPEWQLGRDGDKDIASALKAPDIASALKAPDIGGALMAPIKTNAIATPGIGGALKAPGIGGAPKAPGIATGQAKKAPGKQAEIKYDKVGDKPEKRVKNEQEAREGIDKEFERIRQESEPLEKYGEEVKKQLNDLKKYKSKLLEQLEKFGKQMHEEVHMARDLMKAYDVVVGKEADTHARASVDRIWPLMQASVYADNTQRLEESGDLMNDPPDNGEEWRAKEPPKPEPEFDFDPAQKAPMQHEKQVKEKLTETKMAKKPFDKTFVEDTAGNAGSGKKPAGDVKEHVKYTGPETPMNKPSYKETWS